MAIRHRVRALLLRLLKRTADPPPDQSSVIRKLNDALVDLTTRENHARDLYMERVAELIEARQMMGSGPWTASPTTIAATDRIIERAITNFGKPVPLRESQLTAQGAYGDIELALQNVEWRREVNLSWLEFSRWGIQQIILISRLYYVKNPIIRRLVDVCAAYVFARGVEVSSNDEDANEVLRDFFERNKRTLGQNGLTDLERRKDYDGNLFFVLFSDTQNTGKVNCRTIDATEIQEVVTDPDDVDTPWLYKRMWTQRTFDLASGQSKDEQGEAWYPALGYEPDSKPEMISGIRVMWDSPVLHRKAGAVAKWRFGCPRIYPALDWAKEARKFLEACAAVKAALSQIAMTITTKGGQQALEGIKQQLGTTTGPTAPLWDQNPPAVAGSTFASGPGTQVQAFKQAGVGPNPEEVRQYKLMCAMCAGVPETFLGDVSTGNLATATSLDRPTETVFLEKQEAWREDLVTIAQYVLKVSQGAPSGKLRESHRKLLRECKRRTLPNGRHVYEAFAPSDDAIEVRADFPAIREGDIPQLVHATFEAMAIDRQGKEHGLDPKTAFLKFAEYLGIEKAEEVAEQLYPEKSYARDRTQIEAPDTPQPAAPNQPPQPPPPNAEKQTESQRIRHALRRIEATLPQEPNGYPEGALPRR